MLECTIWNYMGHDIISEYNTIQKCFKNIMVIKKLYMYIVVNSHTIFTYNWSDVVLKIFIKFVVCILAA